MAATLYPGIPFSPQAALTDNIGAGDTIIPVSDVDAFPPAPNLATIGTDEEGETVLYAAKTATALSGCTRGVEGTAKAWQSGELIARNWTAKDHGDLIAAMTEAQQAADSAGSAAEAAAQAAQEAKTGSDPAGTAASAVTAHNSDSTAHEDIRTAAQEALQTHNGSSTAHQALFAAKQDKLAGQPGQVVGFDAAGKAQAVQGWSNPNLLDNWYFADPVNQRGQTEYTENGYTIDRWANVSAEHLTVSLLDDCVHLSSNAPDLNALYIFSQPFTMKDSGLRPGITMTLSFLAKVISSQTGFVVIQIDNDTKQDYSVSSTHPVELGQKSMYSLTFSLPETWSKDDLLRRTFFNYGTAEVDLYAAKLELGSQQTLAHQDADGNWVLNDPPPNKALEFAKCQRYQVVYNASLNDTNHSILVGTGSLDGLGGDGKIHGQGVINLPAPLRGKPAIPPGIKFYAVNSNTPIEVYGMWIDQNLLRINYTVDGSTPMDNKIGMLYCTNTIIDANL